MKILQINASYKPAYIYGGPTMSVAKLSEQLVKAGPIVQVFTTTANGQVELAVPTSIPINVDGVAVTYFKRLTKDHSHFSPALLMKLWRQVKAVDVVHIHAWWNLVSVLSCLVAVVRGIKVIVSPRGTLSAYSFNYKNSLPKKLIHSFIGKPLLNKCFVHTTSLPEQIALQQIINPRQFFNISNFIELPAYTEPEIQPDTNYIKLLFLSRIDEKKGLDILLNALPHANSPYHLTIVGNGDKNYIDGLKQLATQKGINKHLTWLGFQHANKFELFSQNDIFILPSHNENFANVVIESLSAGTAVLISEHVGLANYVSDNKLGWIFKLDEVSLANTINTAIAEKGTLTNIRQTAPLQIRNDFSDQKLQQQYTAMYHEVINHERL